MQDPQEIIAARRRARRAARQKPRFTLTDPRGRVVAVATSRREGIGLQRRRPELSLRPVSDGAPPAPRARDLTAQLDSQEAASRNVAQRLIDEPTRQERQRLVAAREAVAPFANAEGEVDLEAALRGGVSQETLNLLFNEQSVSVARLTGEARESVAPFTRPSGEVDLVAAVEGGVSRDDLLKLFPEDVVLQAEDIAQQQRAAVGDSVGPPELEPFDITVPVPTGSQNVSSTNPFISQAISAELRVRDAQEEVRRAQRRLARAERDVAEKGEESPFAANLESLRNDVTIARQQVARWEADQQRINRLFAQAEAQGARTGVIDTDETSQGAVLVRSFPDARFQITDPNTGEEVGFASGKDAINEAIAQGFEVNPVGIVRPSGIGPPVPPEDFEGGIDTPAAQAALAEQRESLEARAEIAGDIRTQQETFFAQQQLLNDLRRAGIEITDDGNLVIPQRPTEEQIAVLQRATGLSRAAIIGPGLEQEQERLILAGELAAVGFPERQIVEAGTGQRLEPVPADVRAERQAILAERGIPPEISERRERLQEDVDFFVRSVGSFGGSALPVQQQAEFESANRQLVLHDQIIEGLESGELSIPEALRIAGQIPEEPTPQDIESAERLLTAQLEFSSATPVVGLVSGPIATARKWSYSSPTERAFDVTLDVLGVAGLALPAVAGARSSAGVATGAARATRIGGAVATSEILGPTELIADPVRSVRSLFDPVEVVIRRSRIPGLEQTRSTIRLEAVPEAARGDIQALETPELTEALRSGEISPQDVKQAVTDATLDVINNRPAREQIGESQYFVEVAPPVAQQVTGPAAFTATPDVRNFIGDSVVVQGSEGGLFVSFSPHSRFADSTSRGAAAGDLNELTRLQDRADQLERSQPGTAAAIEARQRADDALAAWRQFDQRITPQTRELIEAGRLPNEPVPGVLWIRDPEVLARIRGSEQFAGGGTSGITLGRAGQEGKIYRGKGEFEGVIENQTELPPASQTLIMRGADGKEYTVAVIGEPLTNAQLAQLKLRGTAAAVQNVFAPPIAIRTGDLDSSARLLAAADDLAAEAADLRAAGRVDDAVALERRAVDAASEARRLAARGVDATNPFRVAAAANADLRARELDAEALEARRAGRPVTAAELSRQAAALRVEAEQLRQSVALVRQAATDLRNNPNALVRRSDDISQSRQPGGDIFAGGDINRRADITDFADRSRLDSIIRPTEEGTPRVTRTIIPPEPPPLPPVVSDPRFDREPLPPIPPETEITRTPDFGGGDMGDEASPARLNLRLVGINRGVLDTTVDLFTGESMTVDDLEEVPEIPTRRSFTPLTFDVGQGKPQRVKWGALDLVLGPGGSFTWVKAGAPLPSAREMARLRLNGQTLRRRGFGASRTL